MSKVVAHISASLDGYVAGPNQTLEEPLGAGGEQLLAAGLLDELDLHIAPMLLGDGTRLFEHAPAQRFEIFRVLEGPLATHIRYSVRS